MAFLNWIGLFHTHGGWDVTLAFAALYIFDCNRKRSGIKPVHLNISLFFYAQLGVICTHALKAVIMKVLRLHF